MTNPYQSPQAPEAGPPLRPKKRAGTMSITVGIICLVLAFAGLTQGIKRPPDSTGDLLDDLPFMAGQLFVPIALIALGAFLLSRGYQAREKSGAETGNT